MKDETKHIIAKEIYRFFKLLPICIVLGIVSGIASYFIIKNYTSDPYPDEEAPVIGFAFGIGSLLGVYAYRLIKAGYKWVMKWK